METSEAIAEHLGQFGDLTVRRFDLVQCVSNEPLFSLALFSGRKRLRELLGNQGGERGSAGGNDAEEEFSGLYKHQVGCPRAQVDEQRAAHRLSVVVTEGIVKAEWCQFERGRGHPGLLSGTRPILQEIRFGGYNQHFGLCCGRLG